MTELEDNPHSVDLKKNSPYYQQLQCLAEHAPDIPSTLKTLIEKSRTDDDALLKLIEWLDDVFPTFRPSVSTTQAVDIINGGVKSNALPEKSFAVVNHRIADYRYDSPDSYPNYDDITP